jgi:hypothetical protein
MNHDIAAALETSPPEGKAAAPSVRLAEVATIGVPVLNPEFDVRDLNADAIARLEAAKQRLDRGFKMRRQADLEIATALLTIRNTIPIRWLDFIDVHYPWMSHRSAQLYLGRARLVAEYENFSHLPASALDPLAHAPEEVKRQISDRIEQGERLKVQEVKAVVAKAKEEVKRITDTAKAEIDRIASGSIKVMPTRRDCAAALEQLEVAYDDNHDGLIDLAEEVCTWVYELLAPEPPDDQTWANMEERFQLKAEIDRLNAEIQKLQQRLELRDAAE